MKKIYKTGDKEVDKLVEKISTSPPDPEANDKYAFPKERGTVHKTCEGK